MYNRFECIFPRHYGASFPVLYKYCRSNDNNWVTKGIKISCTKKRELYSLYRNIKDNIKIKDYYKKYCNIVKRVINEAKENNTSTIREQPLQTRLKLHGKFKKKKKIWKLTVI